MYGYATEETDGLDAFDSALSDMNKALKGFGRAKDSAAEALIDVMIPEALDYPL